MYLLYALSICSILIYLYYDYGNDLFIMVVLNNMSEAITKTT